MRGQDQPWVGGLGSVARIQAMLALMSGSGSRLSLSDVGSWRDSDLP
jgi:hypothetical protein